VKIFISDSQLDRSCEIWRRLRRDKEERNILHTIQRWNANWICHILCRNCLLKHVTEGENKGRIEGTRRRGWRRKQQLGDIKEKKGYWKLIEEALDRTLWRTRYGRGYGPVVRQESEWMHRIQHTRIGGLLLWSIRSE